MSSLSIAASGLTAASLRPQVPAINVANISDTRRPPNPNASSTAGSPANPPPTSPSVDLANQAVQQITASNASAANSKAIQAGSNRVGTFFDLKI